MKNAKPFATTKTFARVMRAVNAAFSRINDESANIGWCLIGGRAVELYNNPPQTPDVDILVAGESALESGAAFPAAFRKCGFTLAGSYDPEDPVSFWKHQATGTELDILFGFGTFENRIIRDAKPETINGVSFPLVAIEDLIILKATAAVGAGTARGMMERSEEKAVRDKVALELLIRRLKEPQARALFAKLSDSRGSKEFRLIQSILSRGSKK